jgi:co-chaperonin GroES (HSP10)
MDKEKMIKAAVDHAQVMNGYILVKPVKFGELKTASGLVLSTTRTDDSVKFAEVVRVGIPGDDKTAGILQHISPGDIIVHQNMGHDAFPGFSVDPSDSDTKYLFLNCSYIICRVAKSCFEEGVEL